MANPANSPAPLLPASPHEPNALQMFTDAPAPHSVPLREIAYGKEGSSGQLPSIRRLIRRHWAGMSLLIVAGVAGGLLYTKFQTPLYRARTSIEIQGLNENFLNTRDVRPTSAPELPTEANIQTQIEILQSRSLIIRALSKLDQARQADSATKPGPPSEQTVREAQKQLQVRPNRQTPTIEVLFDSPDPKVAAEFANTVVREFIEYSLEKRWQSTQQTTEWLHRQLDDLKVKIAKAGTELQTFAGNSGLLLNGDKNGLGEEQLKQLQTELSVARADRIAKQARNEAAAQLSPEAMPEMFETSTLAGYRSKLSELKQQSAELMTLLTPENYRVQRVSAEIAEVQAALDKERATVRDRVITELAAATRRAEILNKQYEEELKLLAANSAKSTQFDMLRRELETNRQFYNTLLQRITEANVASAMRATNVAVIDEATPPIRPYKPDLALNLAAGALGGFMLGAIVVILRERGDPSFRHPGDSVSYLQMRELGAIPSSAVPERKRVEVAPDGEIEQPRESPLLSGWNEKPSLITDCYRAAATSILHSKGPGGVLQSVVITSAVSGEGRTLVTANLGIALARSGRRVLLIDGDMRKPHLHILLGIKNNFGLTEILAGRHPRAGDPFLKLLPVEEVVAATRTPQLFLLPVGCDSGADPDLLHSPTMRELVQRFRRDFEYILIDWPSLQIADARILAKLADSAILVVRAGVTSRQAASRAMLQLAEDGTAVLGTILNDWQPDDNTSQFCNWEYYEKSASL